MLAAMVSARMEASDVEGKVAHTSRTAAAGSAQAAAVVGVASRTRSMLLTPTGTEEAAITVEAAEAAASVSWFYRPMAGPAAGAALVEAGVPGLGRAVKVMIPAP